MATSVPPGKYPISLAGVASNCTPDHTTDTAVVAKDIVDSIVFTITCDTTFGRLAIVTATGGQQLDPDGYTVTVDGGTARSIAVNDSITVPNVPAGSRAVALTGSASNCHSTGLGDTTSVPAGGIAVAHFSLTCDTTFGAIAVQTVTTGGSPDLDGYTVLVDNSPHGTIGANASTLVSAIPAGPHTVSLSGLASNCSHASAIVDSVDLSPAGRDSINFAITCPTPATVIVAVSTTGIAPDPDGYTLVVDGGSPTHLAPNVTADTLVLAPGTHDLDLQGVVANCAPTIAGPYSVNVDAGGSATLAITVSCEMPPVVVARSTPSTSYTLYAVNPDGSNPTLILPYATYSGARAPVWSPDRQLIAFRPHAFDGGGGLGIVGSGGQNPHLILDSNNVASIHWAPTGDRLLFSHTPFPINLDLSRIWVIDTSGSNLRQLFPDSLGAISADWSPSGDTVVVHRYAANGYATGTTEIVIVALADSSVHTVVPPSTALYNTPVRWSPDGAWIAYRCSTLGLCTVHPDGTGLTTTALPGLPYGALTWSPNGQSILWTGPDLDIVSITPGAGSWTEVASPGEQRIEPDWK